mmetsp:Transcript_4435/g.16964  ORF Transcript_4435/g.16964 Transcript_4435/m.16964 type:complete len:220 (+) Transcript_4435:1730-2389(+)
MTKPMVLTRILQVQPILAARVAVPSRREPRLLHSISIRVVLHPSSRRVQPHRERFIHRDVPSLFALVHGFVFPFEHARLSQRARRRRLVPELAASLQKFQVRHSRRDLRRHVVRLRARVFAEHRVDVFGARAARDEALARGFAVARAGGSNADPRLRVVFHDASRAFGRARSRRRESGASEAFGSPGEGDSHRARRGVRRARRALGGARRRSDAVAIKN